MIYDWSEATSTPLDETNPDVGGAAYLEPWCNPRADSGQSSCGAHYGNEQDDNPGMSAEPDPLPSRSSSLFPGLAKSAMETGLAPHGALPSSRGLRSQRWEKDVALPEPFPLPGLTLPWVPDAQREHTTLDNGNIRRGPTRRSAARFSVSLGPNRAIPCPYHL